MHIVIDARELVGRATGAGRYLSRLLAHWETLPAAHAHRYSLVAHRAVEWRPRDIRVDTHVLDGGGGTQWEQWTFRRALPALRPDVLFAPAYTAPLATGVPTALAVHDVSFAAHPEWFGLTERWRRRIVTGLAARRARRVLTLSNFSASELVRCFGVDRGKIRVIPLGLGLVDDAAAAGPREMDATAPLVLFVGSIFNRRHVPTLIRAMPAVIARFPHARLAIVGDNRTYPHQNLAAIAHAVGVHDRLDELSFVDDEQLQRLYRQAAVFVFLSSYEGFGLTPLEALAAGVPIAVLDTPVAREVYGAAAHYVERPEVSLVSAAILRLLEDRQARLAVLSEAPGVLARYRWRDAAERTLQAIEESAR